MDSLNMCIALHRNLYQSNGASPTTSHHAAGHPTLNPNQASWYSIYLPH